MRTQQAVLPSADGHIRHAVQPSPEKVPPRSSLFPAHRLAAALCGLLLAAGQAGQAQAAANLAVDPITWDVIGLDSNKVSVGPNEFPVGIRVRNTGNMAATNVRVKFDWTTNNQFINLTASNLGTTDTLTSPSIAPGASALFYFNVTVTRTPAAYFTTRRFTTTVTADTLAPIVTPVRELYVEKILSQSRNDVISFTGPSSVNTGDVVQYTLIASTATNGYEQLQDFINFPNAYFRIISINAHYSAPKNGGAGFTNTIDYANACGWDSNPNSPTYRTCIGPCMTSTCKAGGDIRTVYTVQVLRDIDTTISLTTLIHDFSGSSYHYNADFGVVAIIEPSTNLTIVKSAMPTVIEAGNEFEYMITAANVGGKSADNVQVMDTLPAGITFVSSTPAPSSGTNPQVWNFGTVASGGSREITITALATCDAIASGSQKATKINTATVQTTTKETNLNDNTATASVTIQDTTTPTLVCPADICVNAVNKQCTTPVDLTPPTSTDNCGAAVTVTGMRDDGMSLNSEFGVGTTTITWTATDNHTNQSSCTQTVTYGVVTCPSSN